MGISFSLRAGLISNPSHDRQHNVAILYCSTSDWAFGPVFSDQDDHDANARAEAFLRWLKDTDAVVKVAVAR